METGCIMIQPVFMLQFENSSRLSGFKNQNALLIPTTKRIATFSEV